ncbi:TonB-dependent receptor [Pedobacter ginsenosidimutans]|uniref:TonB-dependent receptor n=1 Tax=Pedobacter ginsenosidimutans TaxID=687842 RepID=A0A0T5VWC5_9SPHI|nr:outer membrane beta-barrel protein [Pedobacter ginsenosidimutans]KRT18139.1 TonB-dependent receptor [Pedobacter ginsenosidimutans]
MKRLLLSLCLFVFMTSYSKAQSLHTIKGRTIDTASTTLLSGTSIAVLNAKDSTLVKFTRAAENGSFELSGIKNGKFILLVSYPKYADFVDHFTLDSTTQVKDYGKINLTGMAKILADVIIKGERTAIKIKGDTTEFNASSYSIQPNDKVEDLLKKLPGIQVDKDGKITAQGKTVPKVLVDGEEFFGDDPTLVTKNLRADMVDKVQLYEKSSDQAAFTGVDDGQKTQTINIKLKEDKKTGFFGKVDAGYGTDDFYKGQVLFNRFKGKQKFSVYGTAGNNGTTGLSWQDNNKLGAGSDNMQMSDDGSMWFSYGGGDELESGSYYGEGIPRALTGGAHYDNKWNSDKESINTNYKLGALGIKTTKNTISQNNLPDGIINTNTDENSDRNVFRQKLDATYTIKLDTTSNLKVSIDGTLKNSDNTSTSNSKGFRGNNSMLNSNDQSNSNDGKEQIFNISAFYTKKLKKLGRNYSVNISQKLNQINSTGYLYSDVKYFDESGVKNGGEVTDQFKTNNTRNSILSTNLTYNEPLSKSVALVLNYGFGINDSRSNRKSFNQSSPGNYDVLDAEFSNDFKATQYINQGGAIFNYKKPKTTISFGSKVSAVNFDQLEQLSGQSYKRSFVNWLPQASYQYKFSAQKSFRISYNGNTTQPSVNQLQPVKVNDNPLYQPLGNPDLAPSFDSRFNVNYNSYKVLSQQSIYVGASFGLVNKAIVSNTQTDASGKTIVQSVNLSDKTPINYNIYSSIGRKLKFLFDSSIGLNLNAGGNTSYSYVKSQLSNEVELNRVTTTRFSPSLDINRYKDKSELYINFGPSYNAQIASLQKDRPNKGWGWQGYGGMSFTLPKKIKFRADGEYTYTPKSQAFDTSFEQIIINASITKSFFKKEDLKFTIQGNDLFNQNRGFRRYAYSNIITQTNYNNISRYFMFSLVWDFNKMGGGTPQK